MDKLFRVEVLGKTPNPQQLIYAAMHTDYSENFVWDERDRFPSEEKAGEIIVKSLLAGNRGHYGPLEHPQIVLNCGFFPHSTMQQIRTHRVGVSFDVQSFRYTGQRIYELGDHCQALFSSFPTLQSAMPNGIDHHIEEVFYVRPTGTYSDRQGKHYEYTLAQRMADLDWCGEASMVYKNRIDQGFSEEHARGLIPFDVRQHWVMSANVRSLMHLLTIRGKKDAQLEIQQLCELILPHFKAWTPQIYEWYMENQWLKGRLAP